MSLEKVKRYIELDIKISNWKRDKKNNEKPTEGEMFHHAKLSHELSLQTDAIYRHQQPCMVSYH
jgi:hypothetical protein